MTVREQKHGRLHRTATRGVEQGLGLVHGDDRVAEIPAPMREEP